MFTSLIKILLQKIILSCRIYQETSPHLFLQNCFPPKGAYQPLSGEDFQQLDEHPSISEVGVQVCDSAGHAGKVGVDPLGEGLFLYGFTLICKQRRTHFTTNPAGQQQG